MVDKLLQLNNPNADALIVPEEQGGDTSDRYFGSIGDATMKHVSSLSNGQRQLWEDLYTSKSGVIFRTMPSTTSHDPDPFNLHGKDLEKYIEQVKKQVKDQTGLELTEEDLVAYREALEVESERRGEDSDDVMDQDTVPYDQWEQFPQMWQRMDIPSAPKDIYIYMGNCNQMFYDEFPTGHPDEANLQRFLTMVNRDWETGYTWSYGKFVKKTLNTWKWSKQYVLNILCQASDKLVEDNDGANEIVAEALSRIDDGWRVDYFNQAAKSALRDPMTKLFLRKEKEWKELSRQSYNVYSSVKAFGQMLFKGFKDQMRSSHWARYRRIKRKYCPKVILGDLDINRCTLNQLMNDLHLPSEKAANLFTHRPFETVDEAFNRGYLGKEAFADDAMTDKIVCFIEKHAAIATKRLDGARLDEVRRVLIKWQRNKEVELSSEQWSSIWKYYRILKADLGRRLKDAREKGEAHGE